MKKYFSNISSFGILFLFVFLLGGLFFPDIAFAQETPSWFDRLGSWFTGAWEGIASVAVDILLSPLGWVAILILQIMNLVLWMAGSLLNGVVNFTVVNMSANIERVGAINTAWTAVRDIANMGFIFVLLYAAIRTILGMGSDTKKLVVNVIIVAILINFSLFFTKLVIDASNVMAIFFYDAMAPGALGAANTGLSNTLMAPLKLETLMQTETIGAFAGKRLIIIGLLGSIFVLIASFVFFAISIMFVIRFVVLIFILILSPIAFMAFVLPALKDIGDKWKDALIGQAFFAPIYFMLTWIVVVVANGLFANTGGSFTEAIGGIENVNNGSIRSGNLDIVINFIIVIALLITSLTVAKTWANRAGSSVTKMTKWATGAAGGAVFGGAAAIGRNVVGSRAADMATNEERKRKASEGNIRARLELAAANKVSRSSFDVRGTGLGGPLDAGKVGKAQQKGFVGVQEERAKSYEKYKPSSEAVKDVNDSEKQARSDSSKAKEQLKEAQEATQSVTQKFGGPEVLGNLERNIQTAEKMAANTTMSTEARQLAGGRVTQLKEQVKSIQEADERNKQAQKRVKESKDSLDKAIKRKEELVGRMERMAKRIEKQNILGISGIITSGKTRAAAVRIAAKSKSAKEQVKAFAKKIEEEEGVTDETEKPETNEGETKTA